MFGRGHDDYLHVKSNGEIFLHENTKSPPNWNTHKEVLLKTKRNRKTLHFGDWDGDGLCDIIAVNRKTGKVDLWRNTYKQGDKVPTFEYKAKVVNNAVCKQGYGPGPQDFGVRFADMDGDKRVDYLCLEPSGKTSVYLNKDKGLSEKPVTTIELANWGRANHRFADLNGDGKADFIYTNKFTGE